MRHGGVDRIVQEKATTFADDAHMRTTHTQQYSPK